LTYKYVQQLVAAINDNTLKDARLKRVIVEQSDNDVYVVNFEFILIVYLKIFSISPYQIFF